MLKRWAVGRFVGWGTGIFRAASTQWQIHLALQLELCPLQPPAVLGGTWGCRAGPLSWSLGPPSTGGGRRPLSLMRSKRSPHWKETGGSGKQMCEKNVFFQSLADNLSLGGEEGGGADSGSDSWAAAPAVSPHAVNKAHYLWELASLVW